MLYTYQCHAPPTPEVGIYWGLSKARQHIPHPWGQLRVTNPLLLSLGITDTC